MSPDILDQIPFFAPIAIGFLMGVLSSLFGTGGGVVTVPLLIFLGVPPAIAAGTQSPAQMVTAGASLRGHLKRKTTDMKLAMVLLSGGLTALVFGNMLYAGLQHWDVLPYVIKGLYIVLMTVIGGSMLFESVMQLLRNEEAKDVRGKVISNVEGWPFIMTFQRSGVETSGLLVFCLGFIAGILISLMGGGGGFFLVPAMMYVLSVDAKSAAGTSLVFTVVTSIVSTFVHVFFHHTVHFLLAGLLIVGGLIGAKLGLFLLQYVRGAFFRLLLGFFILGVGVAIAVQAFLV